jgi:sugar transferase (PEP-CTERM/EpsH1 system associated)
MSAAGQGATGLERLPRPMQPGPAPRPLTILFLYSRLPLPMTRGDELTVAHLLEFLYARGHVVDFVTLAPGGRRLAPQHRAWLESRTRNLYILPHPHLPALLRAGLSALLGRPAQIGLLSSPAQNALAERLAREHRYDLAYAYYIRSAEALLRVRDRVPATFLALQLSQTLNTERLARTAPSLPERLFYRLEHRRIAAYEARIWQHFTRTVLIGEKDLEAIRTACAQHGAPPIDNVVFGPHGVDTERFAPRDPALVDPDLVVMSGVMRYAPNVEAALWFVREVWPQIRSVRPQTRFCLVGRDPVPALRALDGRNGITVTGTVPDPADWIARAAVCVAPIRAAAGLQNKLLEAMAMARPVVATPEANEGIGAADGRELWLARDPRAFAAAVLALLADRTRAEALGRAARAFVVARWTWEGPFLALEREFYRALGEEVPADPMAAVS